MAKPKSDRLNAIKKEYDFSAGVRGKYAKRHAHASNVVELEPDVATLYPDADSVNHALRVLSEAAPRTCLTRMSR